MNKQAVKVGDKVRILKTSTNKAAYDEFLFGIKEVKRVFLTDVGCPCIGVEVRADGCIWVLTPEEYELVEVFKPTPRTEFNSLDDLYSGMKVKTRNGREFIAMKDFIPSEAYDTSILFVSITGGFIVREGYSGFKFIEDEQWDIVEVLKPHHVSCTLLEENQGDWTIVWQEVKPKTEAQLKAEELEATIAEATKQLAELKASL